MSNYYNHSNKFQRTRQYVLRRVSYIAQRRRRAYAAHIHGMSPKRLDQEYIEIRAITDFSVIVIFASLVALVYLVFIHDGSYRTAMILVAAMVALYMYVQVRLGRTSLSAVRQENEERNFADMDHRPEYKRSD